MRRSCLPLVAVLLVTSLGGGGGCGRVALRGDVCYGSEMVVGDEGDGGMSCPHCGVALEVTPQAQEVTCPQCGQTVIVPGLETAEGSFTEKQHDDLDGLRIRQVYQLRRSLYRTRRYWLVGTGICVVAAGQILWKVYTSPAGSMGITTARATVLAIVFVVIGVFCVMQARRLGAVAGRSVLNEPERPPDLSSLSDGSQHWKNLEGMGRDRAGNGPS